MLDGDPAPPKRAQPQFSTHVCCGHTGGWMKIPLGTEVGLDSGYIVLDGDPAHPPAERGTEALPHFSVHAYCGQTVAHLSYC